MVGDNRNKWTWPQLKLLEEMHAAGRQWPAIATAVGHPLNSKVYQAGGASDLIMLGATRQREPRHCLIPA